MVQTILPKGFKRVRYYVFQAACKLKKVRVHLQTVLQKLVHGVFWVGRRHRGEVALSRTEEKCLRSGSIEVCAMRHRAVAVVRVAS
jgi:hypothetical protein